MHHFPDWCTVFHFMKNWPSPLITRPRRGHSVRARASVSPPREARGGEAATPPSRLPTQRRGERARARQPPGGRGARRAGRASARRGRDGTSDAGTREPHPGRPNYTRIHILYDILAIQNISRILYILGRPRPTTGPGQAAPAARAGPRGGRAISKRPAQGRPQWLFRGVALPPVGLRPPVVHALPRIIVS